MTIKNNSERSTALVKQVEELAYHLVIMRKMQDKADSQLIESLGKLSMQELNILNAIGDLEPCIMSDIAKRALLSLSSVTVIVDKLVKSKLVQRVRSEQDRRVVHGHLTEEGKRIYLIQLEHMQSLLNKILSVLTEDERDTFLNLFRKISAGVTNQ